MKQSNINSFIKFIGTVGNKSREKEPLASDDSLIIKGKQQRRHHYNTLSLHEDNNKSHAIVLHKPNKCIIQKCSTDFITSHDSNIKHRYEDKQSLYEAYRNSLQKKKDQLQLGTNKLINKLSQIQQSQSFSKQSVFPIKHKKNIQQAKYSHQKIFSNRSISICPQQSGKKLKTQKFYSNQKTEIFAKKEEEYLREKKLDYKPIFRVKKVHLLESYRTQTAPPLKQQFTEATNIKKQRQSLGCKVKIKIKTEPIQTFSKIISFRDKMANKNKGAINTIEKVGGWDYDQSQQTSRIFF